MATELDALLRQGQQVDPEDRIPWEVMDLAQLLPPPLGWEQGEKPPHVDTFPVDPQGRRGIELLHLMNEKHASGSDEEGSFSQSAKIQTFSSKDDAMRLGDLEVHEETRGTDGKLQLETDLMLQAAQIPLMPGVGVQTMQGEVSVTDHTVEPPVKVTAQLGPDGGLIPGSIKTVQLGKGEGFNDDAREAARSKALQAAGMENGLLEAAAAGLPTILRRTMRALSFKPERLRSILAKPGHRPVSSAAAV